MTTVRAARRGLLPLLGAALVVTACSTDASPDEPVRITGSATVAPIAAINARYSHVRAEIDAVGTNEGFEAFCAGDADISGASVQMPGNEGDIDFRGLCLDSGVEFVEVLIGYDALSLIRHVDNDGVENLSMDELARIWELGSEVTTWADVRDGWPEEEIVLFGRDDGSGTYSVFTEEILGESGAIGEDYAHTDDLDELTSWAAQEPGALAFMGVGNYLAAPEKDRDRITTIDVEGIPPDRAATLDGRYPLARTLYLYVSVESLEQDDDVERFVRHLLENGQGIVPRAFFYPLDEAGYAEGLERLEERTDDLT